MELEQDATLILCVQIINFYKSLKIEGLITLKNQSSGQLHIIRIQDELHRDDDSDKETHLVESLGIQDEIPCLLHDLLRELWKHKLTENYSIKGLILVTVDECKIYDVHFDEFVDALPKKEGSKYTENITVVNCETNEEKDVFVVMTEAENQEENAEQDEGEDDEKRETKDDDMGKRSDMGEIEKEGTEVEMMENCIEVEKIEYQKGNKCKPCEVILNRRDNKAARGKKIDILKVKSKAMRDYQKGKRRIVPHSVRPHIEPGEDTAKNNAAFDLVMPNTKVTPVVSSTQCYVLINRLTKDDLEKHGIFTTDSGTGSNAATLSCFCGKKFERSTHLQNHMLCSHTEKNIYTCNVCNSGFKDQYKFSIHFWENHKSKKVHNESYTESDNPSSMDSAAMQINNKDNNNV